MPSHNLYALFRNAFGKHLERTAIQTDEGARYSFADLDQQSSRMACWLESLGVAPGDRVVVQVEKSVPALIFYLACLRAGVVYVPLNTAYQSAELSYFLESAEPRLFVVDPAKVQALGELATRLNVPHVATLGADGQGSLVDAAQGQGTDHAIRDVPADTVAAILYTSGTTGRSKGAQLTHRNLSSNAQTLHTLWGWEPGDVLIHALPIFHVHGLFVAVHCALLNASRRWNGLHRPPYSWAFPPSTCVCCRRRRLRPSAARTCACSSAGRRRCSSTPSASGRNAPATPSWSATA